ncbi:hypothetical protein SAMN05216357_103171 [Porphyromonadaceae bacterium KH3CP3RA]|nr:hypothetical protein SAMN05216357_103171 [Porphyromonadaceae bacterium KH3CP3RA]
MNKLCIKTKYKSEYLVTIQGLYCVEANIICTRRKNML